MGNIVLLDELTINQIAAGEVIERPASVVKELVENSIDAGANNIVIEIKNGGISYIRITDNGKGIMPDDMEMAFERHATSKIRSAGDLQTVTSMGFRGEALASIAAISQVELTSKAIENDMGYKIVVKGGEIINKEEAGCSQGTTILVTDLFYNTPVRYKFLKKDFTEAGYIEDIVTKIALIHPEISIKLINTGKTIIQTSGNGDMKTVVYNIYGKDVAENIIDINYDYEDIKVTGVVGKPIIARSNRSNQIFFVNKRNIRDKSLTSAAEQGFKGLLTIGKYGFLILNIQMDPKMVDVNVHPTKLEVRFEDESKVFKAIYHTIKDSLLKEDLIPDKTRIEINKEIGENNNNNNIEQNGNFALGGEEEKTEEIKNTGGLFLRFGKEKQEVSEVEKAEPIENKGEEENIEVKVEENVEEKSDAKLDNVEEEHKNFIEEIYKIKNNIANNIEGEKLDTLNESKSENESEKNENEENNENGNENEATKKIDIDQINEKMEQLNELKMEQDYGNFEEMYAKTFGTTIKETKVEEEAEDEYKINPDDIKVAENISIFSEEEQEEHIVPKYNYIGIAFNTYIIIEMNQELYMIDQHAAHERILYEKIKKNYYSEEEKDSQLMLLPDIINLTHRDMQIAKDNMDIFEKAGFVLEEFGENTIKLTGVPNICIDLDTKELFLETLDEINTVARTAKQEIEDRFIATIACKAAVKANMVLRREEVDNLINDLLVLKNPFTCPHGRPTAIRMTKSDMEKKFSRR